MLKTNSISITNIQPNDVTTIHTTIPADNPNYLQSFSNSISLDTLQFNYISRITLAMDTAGIYNVRPVNRLNPDTGEIVAMEWIVINNYNTKLGTVYYPKGNYTLENLVDGINAYSVNTTSPIITIKRTDKFAYRTIINFYFPYAYELDFTNAPTLQQILGLFDLQYPKLVKIQVRPIAGSSIKKGTFGVSPDGLYGVKWGEEYISLFPFDSTAGYDSIFITNDLIKQSSLISQNYLVSTSVNVPPGEILVYTANCNIPLSKTNFSSINWFLFNRFTQPYIISTPVELYIEILTQNK